MNTDSCSAARAFATIRFSGDALDPALLTDALRVRPTLSYERGQTYSLGRRGLEKIGSTGYWFLNTKSYLDTSNLDIHTNFISKLLTDDVNRPHRDRKFEHINSLIKTLELTSLVTLFWFGRLNSSLPTVSPLFSNLISLMNGDIEEDFTVKSQQPGNPNDRAA